MMPTSKKIIHVLDIAGGTGEKVGAALRKKFPDGKIHHTIIDSFSKEYALKPGRKIAFGKPLVDKSTEVKRVIHGEGLDFSNPKALGSQLSRLLGKAEFDEIHFHMPDGFSDEDTFVSEDEERIFSENRKRVEDAAAKAGLNMEKYGFGGKGLWSAASARKADRQTNGRREKISRAINKMISRHTDFSANAHHYVVLRKP
ncbi:hypothetical protein HY993_02690 [Candidatus Micrarchaeota archaeon]|nr:hypothetical protein [Candidatus Micrarchaeota archaeon]